MAQRPRYVQSPNRRTSSPQETALTTAAFYGFARARHQIALDRAAGLPAPWTTDPILLRYKFTNVFREMDRTTLVLRRLTDPIRGEPEVMLLTVALRWFCRIETWRTLYAMQPPDALPVHQSRWIAGMLETDHGRHNLQHHLMVHGRPPWITGAYIVQTETGLDKLSGVFAAIGRFAEHRSAYGVESMMGWRDVAERMLARPTLQSLRRMHFWLLGHDRLGPFMAYEMLTDLRHTDILCQASDIMTWANAGPGAMRGLNRIHGRRLGHTQRPEVWCREMELLLEISQDPEMWPSDWPSLEMRDVEHTLCEFDKYLRVKLGEGTPRSLFRPNPEPLPTGDRT